MPDKLDQVVESASSRIAELAHWMGDTQSVLFLGRNVGYPIALEGALKLKELAYLHAESLLTPPGPWASKTPDLTAR